MGGFSAVVLARTHRRPAEIREEFNARVARIELPDKSYKTLVAPFETKYDSHRPRVAVRRPHAARTARARS